MYEYVCVCVCVYICLSVCLSVWLSVCDAVCRYLSVTKYAGVRLSVSVSVSFVSMPASPEEMSTPVCRAGAVDRRRIQRQ